MTTTRETTDQRADLSDLLCFDLYAASRAVTSLYRPLLAELGLTYPQYLVLVLLWRSGFRTVKQIAASLQLDHGTLTPLLRRMETNGLLTRTRSTSDERVVQIRLTPAGKALEDRFDDIQCAVRAALGITPAQFGELQLQLRAVTAAVADTGSRPR